MSDPLHKTVLEITDADKVLQLYAARAARMLGIEDESLITHACILIALERQESIEKSIRDVHQRNYALGQEIDLLRQQVRYLTALLASRFRKEVPPIPTEVTA